MPTGDQRGHDDPFRNGWAVDSTAGRDGDIAVSEDWVVGVVVHTRGEEVDELEAGGVSSAERADWGKGREGDDRSHAGTNDFKVDRVRGSERSRHLSLLLRAQR